MGEAAVQPGRIGHVSLRVGELRRSVAFYSEVLGLTPGEADPPSRLVRVCRSVSPTGDPVSVILMVGLPRGSELTGLDHFSLSVSSRDEVDAAYGRALDQGAQATRPRVYAGGYQTFLFDPDGYKIELRSAETGMGPGEGKG